MKGIGALGNQLTKYKVLEINALEPLPFEQQQTTPAAAIEVVGEQTVKSPDGIAAQTTQETTEPKSQQQKPAEDTAPTNDKEPPIGEGQQGSLF